MKVAVVKTGPGATRPTATASSNWCSVSHRNRSTRSARRNASSIPAAKDEGTGLHEDEEHARERNGLPPAATEDVSGSATATTGQLPGATHSGDGDARTSSTATGASPARLSVAAATPTTIEGAPDGCSAESPNCPRMMYAATGLMP